ncbi:GNAT family N-acetyltransferase [Antarcticibacterium sp. 1MA-6-2]|uniref:GNAT family N-acetyltransferase n=1 Tax=Antarcticibacterium sp. 1MA-6-2 TaxID=2908210 RepID=UPI001F33D1F6|nr:GNAT family N-acetyltransferase [Antarcticibacterium sp. 1MA-6-2]UJH90475.1 GNAT family N-acetyltransferase [Antarcticibacterium sp. 1MA-6-2]
MSFPEIKTERLLLRQFQQDDLENVFYGLSHPEVIRYYGVNYKSLEETQKQIKWFRELDVTGTGIWWAITSLEEKQFLGGIGINSLNEDHQKAEIGYWLLPDFWGKGIIAEAGRELIQYAFKNLNLHRIEAYVEDGNQNSEKLLEKLDFNYEGTMGDCEIKNGNFISVKIYARLNKKTKQLNA